MPHHVSPSRLPLALIALAGVSALALNACSRSSSGDGGSPTPPPSEPTVIFTLAPEVSVAETETAVGYTFDLSEFEGAVDLSITGGADEALFTVNDDTLFFTAAPDFEAPGDTDGDNVYEVTLEATDADELGRWTMSISVTDLAENYQVVRLVSGLDQPVYVTGTTDGSGRLYIVERGGQIEIYDPATGTLSSQKLLDVSSETTTDGEQGLLGFTLAPDFEDSGLFYIALTNADGDSQLRRYQVRADNPDVADTTSMEVILTLEETINNHNGNWIGFGPDGYLYWGVGDGGGAGDPLANGQDTSTLHGSILRIDPEGDDFPGDASRNYTIPADNPFVSGGGDPAIYAYGFRNPSRVSFDPASGYMYIGDVGQDAMEEIDLLRPEDAGGNYGWVCQEGTQAYNGCADEPDFIDPIAQYDLPARNAVTGGYVYRGPVAPLRGKYIFADFVTGRIFSFDVDDAEQGSTLSQGELNELTGDFTPDAGTLDNVPSFGTDADGNLYIVDIEGEVFMVEPRD